MIQDYLRQAAEMLDDEFGHGYARDNPEAAIAIVDQLRRSDEVREGQEAIALAIEKMSAASQQRLAAISQELTNLQRRK